MGDSAGIPAETPLETSVGSAGSFVYDRLPDAHLAPLTEAGTSSAASSSSSSSPSLDSIADRAASSFTIDDLSFDAASLLLPHFSPVPAVRSTLHTAPRLPISIVDAPANSIPKQELPSTATKRVALKHQHTKLQVTPLRSVPLQAIQTRAPKAQPLRRIPLGTRSAQLPPLSVAAESKFPLQGAAYARRIPPQDSAPGRKRGSQGATHMSKLPPLEPLSKAKTHSSALPPMARSISGQQGVLGLHTASLPSARLRTLKPTKQAPQRRQKRPEPLFTSVGKAGKSVSRSAGKSFGKSVSKSTGKTAASRLALESQKDERKFPLSSQERERMSAVVNQKDGRKSPVASQEREYTRRGSDMFMLAEQRLPMQGQQVELHPISAVQQPVRTRTSKLVRAHD